MHSQDHSPCLLINRSQICFAWENKRPLSDNFNSGAVFRAVEGGVDKPSASNDTNSLPECVSASQNMNISQGEGANLLTP